jgi:hypothetical protein
MPRSPQSPTATSLARLIRAYAGIWDEVAAAVGVADNQQSDTPDQRTKAAEVAALHKIGQKAVRHRA